MVIASCSCPLRLVPIGMVNEAVDVVPFAPITSIGNEIVVGAGVAAGEEDCSVKLAVPRTSAVEAFIAITVMPCCVATLFGAV